MKSILIDDYTGYKWEEQRTVIRYQDIINFERAGVRGEHHCVMCGLIKGKQCEIPNQNKDVCKKCDCSYWKILDGDYIVKFCKGRCCELTQRGVGGSCSDELLFRSR